VSTTSRPSLTMTAIGLGNHNPRSTLTRGSMSPLESANTRATVAMAPTESRTIGAATTEVQIMQHQLPRHSRSDRRLAVALAPDSERAAAFRVLRHHLLELGKPQAIIVSSPQRGDGKTTTAINLACALSECNRAKVLLVETNLRRPQLSTVFEFVPPRCFADQLIIHRKDPLSAWTLVDIPDLCLHVGAVNPKFERGQLLDGPAFSIAMERLRLAGYDHIVVDAPAVLGSADVNLMADAADTVILALRARRSTARDLRAAMDQIGERKIGGTVLVED
jgi:Mrp family chromosome partitioning ATPase